MGVLRLSVYVGKKFSKKKLYKKEGGRSWRAGSPRVKIMWRCQRKLNLAWGEQFANYWTCALPSSFKRARLNGERLVGCCAIYLLIPSNAAEHPNWQLERCQRFNDRRRYSVGWSERAKVVDLKQVTSRNLLGRSTDLDYKRSCNGLMKILLRDRLTSFCYISRLPHGIFVHERRVRERCPLKLSVKVLSLLPLRQPI